ncbi:unnamed protein product, partial [Nesidiocoris tenuis]
MLLGRPFRLFESYWLRPFGGKFRNLPYSRDGGCTYTIGLSHCSSMNLLFKIASTLPPPKLWKHSDFPLVRRYLLPAPSAASPTSMPPSFLQVDPTTSSIPIEEVAPPSAPCPLSSLYLYRPARTPTLFTPPAPLAFPKTLMEKHWKNNYVEFIINVLGHGLLSTFTGVIVVEVRDLFDVLTRCCRCRLNPGCYSEFAHVIYTTSSTSLFWGYAIIMERKKFREICKWWEGGFFVTPLPVQIRAQHWKLKSEPGGAPRSLTEHNGEHPLPAPPSSKPANLSGCQRKGRSYKVYNIERRKSSDDSSSNESYSQILDRDSIQKSKDGYPRPLKRKRSENSAQRPDGSQRAKSGQEIDIFEVERRMLNDRLFHRYFEHNKVKSTPIWMKFEPVAIDNEPDGPYSKPIVRTDSMKTLRGSINRPSSATESDATDTQTPDKPTSAVQELRKRFEDFQSGKSNGDNKNEKEGLQELLNRAASEFTGNIGDLDPELIEQGKKYLKAKGVTFGDLMSVAGSSKYSLKTIVSVYNARFSVPAWEKRRKGRKKTRYCVLSTHHWFVRDIKIQG